jgi:hypothetical protein
MLTTMALVGIAACLMTAMLVVRRKHNQEEMRYSAAIQRLVIAEEERSRKREFEATSHHFKQLTNR